MGLFDNINVQVGGTQDYLKTLTTYNTVILKPNIEGNRNVLRQSMVREKNTKYVIRWNYLLGEDIIMPKGCLIEFDGGSIGNEGNQHTLTGNDTILIYSQEPDVVIKGVELKGRFITPSDAISKEEIDTMLNSEE